MGSGYEFQGITSFEQRGWFARLKQWGGCSHVIKLVHNLFFLKNWHDFKVEWYLWHWFCSNWEPKEIWAMITWQTWGSWNWISSVSLLTAITGGVIYYLNVLSFVYEFLMSYYNGLSWLTSSLLKLPMMVGLDKIQESFGRFLWCTHICPGRDLFMNLLA